MSIFASHPGGASGGGTGSDAPGGKSDKRKQTLIAIAAVVGVLLTYLLYRRSATGAATAAAVPSAADTSTGDASNPTSTDSPTEDAALDAIGDQLTALTTALTPSSSGTGTSTIGPTGPIATGLTGPVLGDFNLVRNAVTGAVYQVQADGSLYYLNREAEAILDAPKGTAEVGYSDANQTYPGEVGTTTSQTAQYGTPVGGLPPVATPSGSTAVPLTTQAKGVSESTPEDAVAAQRNQFSSTHGMPVLQEIHTMPTLVSAPAA